MVGREEQREFCSLTQRFPHKPGLKRKMNYLHGPFSHPPKGIPLGPLPCTKTSASPKDTPKLTNVGAIPREMHTSQDRPGYGWKLLSGVSTASSRVPSLPGGSCSPQV